MTAIERFAVASAAVLVPELLTLTHAPAWATALVAGRPFSSLDALLARSDALIMSVPENQIDAALAGHPRIGQRATNLDAQAAARSAREQAGMQRASASTAAALAEANADYEAHFGRIYLVCAAGLSAQQMLDFCRARLANDPVAELAVVRAELAKITRLRLIDWLAASDPDGAA